MLINAKSYRQLSNAELNPIQHQQLCNCVKKRPELQDTVEESSNLPRHYDEENHDEDDLLILEGFRYDLNKENQTLAIGPQQDEREKNKLRMR